MGIVKTKQMLRTKVWWPTINKDVEEVIKHCKCCQLVTEGSIFEPLRPNRTSRGSLGHSIHGHAGTLSNWRKYPGSSRWLLKVSRSGVY